MKPFAVEFGTIVTSRSIIAQDVLRIDLARADGGRFPSWDPGSHIDVVLPSGTERQYSLCGDKDDQSIWTIAVLHEKAGRGASGWLHAHAEIGSAIRVRGPSNHFALEPASRYRFIAAGIGITAILPMIRASNSSGAAWELDYSASSVERAAFLDEVRALNGGRVRMHIADAGQRLDIATVQQAEGELIYGCGPARLLDALIVQSQAWTASTLHIERFEALHPILPFRQEAFTVDLLVSGMTLAVSAQQSILDAAEDAGIFALSSCREGTCGTCEIVVKSGLVDHRDSILTAAERQANDRMMICISRAASSSLALEL